MTAALRILTVALMLLPATAIADFYQYETDEGVLSFTDDAERIPARYADAAQRRDDRPLADYERLSVSKPGAATATLATTLVPDPSASQEQVAHPLPHTPVPPGLRPTAPGSISLQVDEEIVLELGARDDEPIYVDRRHYMTRNGIMTPHTVVSRGDKPLVYISDRPR